MRARGNLRGKLVGAVGAYNASSLLLADPIEFEREALSLLDVLPGDHSTQIVEPEYVLDLAHALISTFGVLANFADDMRHLQRTELSEVGEAFCPRAGRLFHHAPQAQPLELRTRQEHVEGIYAPHDDRVHGSNQRAPAGSDQFSLGAVCGGNRCGLDHGGAAPDPHNPKTCCG